MSVNLFKISKAWFELSFEDHRITPTHTAFLFYLIDLNNRLAWVDNFGLPAIETSQALNISYNTFRKILKDMIDFGHVRMIKKSTNQYTANIISLNLLYQNLLKQKKSKLKASLKQHIKQSDINKPIKLSKPKNISNEIKNFTASLSKLFPQDITSKLKDNEKWNWIDTIDKLIRIDKFTNKEIEKAVNAGRNSDFWNKQFLSLIKLRKKNKDDIKYINVFLNLNGHVEQSTKLKEFK